MSQRVLLSLAHPAFTWIDVVEPSREELDGIALAHGLHATSVLDCLDPEHLPKYERIGQTTFIIVRAIDEAAAADCATVQEMTRKVAIFVGPGFLLTIHRTEQKWLTRLQNEAQARWEPGGTELSDGGASIATQLVSQVVNGAIDTYTKPLERSENIIGQFESTVFGDDHLTATLRGMYLEKRRVTLMKRLLWHTADTVERLIPASDPVAPYYQDLRENAESMRFYAEDLFDDVTNLLSIQLAVASNRTNEVMRVLTVFSAFFLPLTFIVGIYGMNFQFMPEIRQRWGYPAVLAIMALVALGIFLWFRRRGWLKE